MQVLLARAKIIRQGRGSTGLRPLGYHAWRGKPSGGGGEGRDPHSDNRSGGNRSGIAPTAAPLRPEAGAPERPGLYTDLRRALLSLLERGFRFTPLLRCARPRVVRA